MDKSEPESDRQPELTSTSSSVDLDAVFSKFFQKLEKLPLVHKPRSARDYIESNRDKIVHALSKGHTYEDLASLLKECGFSISASTLRRYVGSVKGRKGEPREEKVEPTEEIVEPDAATDPSTLLAQLSDPDPTAQQQQPQLKPRRK
jgi:hypothetical protein